MSSVNNVECSTCGRDGGPIEGCDTCHGRGGVQESAYTLSQIRANPSLSQGNAGGASPRVIKLPGSRNI